MKTSRVGSRVVRSVRMGSGLPVVIAPSADGSMVAWDRRLDGETPLRAGRRRIPPG
ncbi:hypothetical protein [Haloarchaeobius sp. DYHT-AS-18]|uniref:hypothetical protein n=1 Tax=Haloarchaeobius sp. DYHT-AS-18 TaxID=3446117 RepID=UPI003EB8DABE